MQIQHKSRKNVRYLHKHKDGTPAHDDPTAAEAHAAVHCIGMASAGGIYFEASPC